MSWPSRLAATAECACLLLQVADVADLVDPGIRLDAIAIDDHGDLVQAAIRRLLKRLPELPLLELAVAGQDVHASGPAGDRLASAKPRAFETPMPSEPVLVTTSGVAATSGCPGRPSRRRSWWIGSKSSRPSAQPAPRRGRGVVALGREVPVSLPEHAEVKPGERCRAS